MLPSTMNCTLPMLVGCTRIVMLGLTAKSMVSLSCKTRRSWSVSELTNMNESTVGPLLAALVAVGVGVEVGVGVGVFQSACVSWIRQVPLSQVNVVVLTATPLFSS